MQQILRDLSDVIGVGDAYEIVKRWSGRKLRVPQEDTLTRDHPLSLTVGFEKAKKMCSVFGGEVLDLPIERNALRSHRNRLIYQEVTEGKKSIRSVGDNWGMSHANVLKIVEKVSAELAAEHA